MKAVKSITKIIAILIQQDFSPKGVNEIAEAAKISRTTAWRQLTALQEDGWTIYNPTEHTWHLGKAIADIAFAYKRHMLSKMNSFHQEYEEIAGETLNHD